MKSGCAKKNAFQTFWGKGNLENSRFDWVFLNVGLPYMTPTLSNTAQQQQPPSQNTPQRVEKLSIPTPTQPAQQDTPHYLLPRSRAPHPTPRGIKHHFNVLYAFQLHSSHRKYNYRLAILPMLGCVLPHGTC